MCLVLNGGGTRKIERRGIPRTKEDSPSTKRLSTKQGGRAERKEVRKGRGLILPYRRRQKKRGRERGKFGRHRVQRHQRASPTGKFRCLKTRARDTGARKESTNLWSKRLEAQAVSRRKTQIPLGNGGETPNYRTGSPSISQISRLRTRKGKAKRGKSRFRN